MSWTEDDKTKIRSGLLALGSSAAIRSVAGSALTGLDWTYHDNPRVLILEIIRVGEEDDLRDKGPTNWTRTRLYKILQAIKFVQG